MSEQAITFLALVVTVILSATSLAGCYITYVVGVCK